MGKIMFKGQEFQGRIERTIGIASLTMQEYSRLTPEEIATGYYYVADYDGIRKESFPYIGSGIKRSEAITITEDTTNKTISTVYDGGVYIGAEIRYKTPIDLTNVDSITFDLSLGDCYGGGTEATTQRFYYTIAILNETNIETSDWLGGETTNLYEAFIQYKYSNRTYKGTLSVEHLTGYYYLGIACHGWNSVLSNIYLESGYSGEAVSKLGEIFIPLEN